MNWAFSILVSSSVLIAPFFALPTFVQAACSDLDHRACFESTECTLDWSGKKEQIHSDYICRERRAPCETGFSNATAYNRAEECKKRVGCSLSTGNGCYCGCEDPKHPDYRTCACECGGNLPFDCRRVTQK